MPVRSGRRLGVVRVGIVGLGIVRVSVALLLGVLFVVLWARPAWAATSWGTAGARYTGGIVCTLGGGERVPMAHWQVDGQQAFATTDVVGTPTEDGPAPVGGTLTPMTAGQDGLDDHAIAVLAYLIAHHGDGSPPETAEVSAAVASTFGSGSDQNSCLGQQGTGVAAAAALQAEAERLAGPYRLALTAPSPAPPGTVAHVQVILLAASGAAVPGVEVTAAGAGQSVTAAAGTDGVAQLPLTVPAVASSPVNVTVQEPTGLLIATDTTPVAVTLGPPSPTVATTTLVADLHPHPVLHVDVGGGLEAEHSSVAPVAHISGTYGFHGTGTLTLAGPATPGPDGSCSSLPASAFAAAPNAWSRNFSFDGDGPQPVGAGPSLEAGCYVGGGSLTVDGVTPAATANAPFEDSAVIDVIRLGVHRSAVPVLALPGRVSTSVSVDAPDGTTASSAATVYGPVAPRAGRCDGLSWTGAPVARGRGAALAPPTSGDARTMVVVTQPLTARGCYSIPVTTTVHRDGRTLTLPAERGSSGTVVFIIRPSFSLADDTYDTTQGTPMTGSVSVVGTFRYPAVLTVRLRSAPPQVDGCRSVTFAGTTSGPAVDTRTSGDGTFYFRTPVPNANACYAIVASLQMVDAKAVRVAGPDPSPATLFLAGHLLEPPTGPHLEHRGDHTPRAAVALLGSVSLVLAIAVAVIGWIGRAGFGFRPPDRPVL